MFELWSLFCYQRELPMPEIQVSDLVNYLDFLKVNCDYAQGTLSMHASPICRTLQPMEQMRASTVPTVKRPLKGMFRKNPPPRVLTKTSDIKKVIDLLHSWRKPAALNYTRLTLKMVLVLATVNRSSDLNSPRVTPRAMQVTSDLFLSSHFFGQRIPSLATLIGHQ